MIIENPQSSIDRKNNISRQYLRATVSGGIFGVAFFGPGGVGKTHLIVSFLEQLEGEFVCAPIYSSFLAWVKFIAENRNKTILFDDVAPVTNKAAAAILKTLLAPHPITKVRELSFNASRAAMKREGFSEKLINELKGLKEGEERKGEEGIQGRVLFTGRIITISNGNELPKDIHALAIRSRIPHYHYDLTFSERLHLIKKFAETPEVYKLEQVQMDSLMELVLLHASPTCRNFDLRLLDKAAAIVLGSPLNWRHAVCDLLEVDARLEEVRVLLEMCKYLGLTQEVAVEAFKRKTGQSRSTFYNLLKRFEPNGGPKPCQDFVDNLRPFVLDAARTLEQTPRLDEPTSVIGDPSALISVQANSPVNLIITSESQAEVSGGSMEAKTANAAAQSCGNAPSDRHLGRVKKRCRPKGLKSQPATVLVPAQTAQATP